MRLEWVLFPTKVQIFKNGEWVDYAVFEDHNDAIFEANDLRRAGWEVRLVDTK